MKTYYIKQKLWSLKDRYTVLNEQQEDEYYIEGSLMKFPKRFQIINRNGEEIAQITRKVLALLPKFEVDIVGHYPVTIKKNLGVLNEKYTIEAEGIEVTGEWWNFHFEIWKDGQLIGSVAPKIFTWADTYELTIHDEAYEKLIVSIAITIDCANEEQSIISDAILFWD